MIMEVKTLTTTEVSLVFELEELKELYHKLVAYCKFDPARFGGSKAPTDEVEGFLIKLEATVIKLL